MTYEQLLSSWMARMPKVNKPLKGTEWDMVREALEMQMPLKPTMFDNCGNVTATDRCCKCYEIIWNNYSHCPYCGQAIDWSDLE